MTTNTLVLSFAVPAKGRSKPFTSSMEVAVVVLLTEVYRKKHGFLRAGTRSTSFVSKLHYPLWAVPQEDGSMIVDGLGVFSSSVDHTLLPEVTAFLDDIERGASVRKEFQSALLRHANTFRNYAKTEKVHIPALVSDAELLSALSEYIEEAASQEAKTNGGVNLAPLKLDQAAAVETVKQVADLRKMAESETKSLEYAAKLLDDATKIHERMIRKETDLLREDYDKQISTIRPSVEKKVDQLINERDSRIAKMSRTMEQELSAREREKERREHQLQKMELDKANFEKKREVRKQRHDKIGVTHWEHRIRVDENKMAEVKTRVNSLREFIEKTRRQNEADIEKLRYGYEALIEREKRKVSEIEIQRDRDVEVKQAEIDKLRLGANQIAGQIEQLAQEKRDSLNDLRKLTVPRSFDDTSLICVPFYIAGYQVEKKTQLQVFPPFKVVSSNGIVKAVEKTFRSVRLVSRIGLFMQPRSKALSRMLESVSEEKMKDKAFLSSLLQVSTSASILKRQDFVKTLFQGVKELRAEGWISQGHGDALIKMYAS